MESSKSAFVKTLSDNVNRPGVPDLFVYLEKEGFYTSPASTKYHGSYEGGLCDHSMNVYYSMLDELSFIYGGKDKWTQYHSLESATIVSLLHDVCKAGKYVKGTKNVKDPETGRWDTVDCYNYNTDAFQMGHGALSVYRIQKFIKLTDEEAQAIYWHMGAYDLSQYSTVGNLSESFAKNTLAFALHRADMMATYVWENENLKGKLQ